MRIASDEVSYAHGQAWRDIYGTQAKVNPTRSIRGVEEKEGHHSIVMANGDVHTRQKRIISSVFSERMIKEKEHVFDEYADLMIRRLAEHEGRPLAIADWYNFTSFDIVGHLLFDESLGLLAHSQYVPWVEAIPEFLKGFAMIVVLYEYRLFRILWTLMPSKFLNTFRDAHFRYTGEKLDRYFKLEEKERRGILQELLQGGRQKSLSIEELYPNAPVLVFGASETSATQTRFLTYLLLKNPEITKKLTHELRSTFSASNEITYDSLLRLKYLNLCIEEGLRMYPPCTNGLPRIVQRGGTMICGEWVPGGTNVSVATHSLHRSARYFQRADSFIPERWLGEKEGRPEEFAADDLGVVMPFSYGPHSCPGKK